MDDTATLSYELQRIPHLLLVRLRSLGDSILSLPLVEALHHWRPDLGIDIVSEAPFVPVFARHPAIRDVLSVATAAAPSLAGRTRVRTLAEIRRRRYPAVLNLHGGTTSMVLTLASSARIRIGQGSFRNSWAYNYRIPASAHVWRRREIHTVEHQLTLLRWLGLPIPPEVHGSLHIDPEASARVSGRLDQSGLAPLGYVAIHPTATLFTKQWKEENFARLADLLSASHGLQAVFTAAPHEVGILDRIRRCAAGNHHYWHDLNLGELFALIEMSKFFVGNDSGPTHAASALKKPTVVVWGSSNFVAWRPWKVAHELVRSDLACMPCAGYTCEAYGQPKCILDISVDRVAAACRRLLDRIP